jgi:hypothetical protein
MRKCGAQTLLTENLTDTTPGYKRNYRPLRKELRALQKARPSAQFRATQLTFFSEPIPKGTAHVPNDITAGHILATCIIVTYSTYAKSKSTSRRRVRQGYVFEAIIPFPTLVPGGLASEPNGNDHREQVLNNYYHIGSEIVVVIAGRTFELNGAYFCQQNGVTGVCAQAAMRMALWNISHLKKVYSNEELNRAARRSRKKLGFPPPDNPDPAQGFDIEDIKCVCHELGIDMLYLDCQQHPSVSPYEFAYLLVESGISTIMAFLSENGSDGSRMVMPGVTIRNVSV